MFDDQRYFIVINDMHNIAHFVCIHNLLQCSTTHEIFFDNQKSGCTNVFRYSSPTLRRLLPPKAATPLLSDQIQLL